MTSPNRNRMARRPWRALRLRPRILWVIALAVITAVPGAVRAQTLNVAHPSDYVPAESAVPILFKVLTYDRTLESARLDTLRVAVLWSPSSELSRQTAQEFAEALSASQDKTVSGVPFQYRLVSIEGEDWKDEVTQWQAAVAYVAADMGDELDKIKEFARANHILSLGAVPGDVREGISIGLRLAGRRPRILVNLRALRDEGHDLSARVLRLCEVVDSENES